MERAVIAADSLSLDEESVQEPSEHLQRRRSSGRLHLMPSRELVSPLETVEAYDSLAHEYDDRAHKTTRALEEASIRGFSMASQLLTHQRPRAVLELGCGSGAFTGALAALPTVETVVACDPSHRMLSVAIEKIEGPSAASTSVVFTRADAVESLWRSTSVDLVAGSLADPYLDRRLATTLPTFMREGAYAFFSVPSRRWAASERSGRLRIPLSTTRFRTSDGGVLRAASAVYNPLELRGLFEVKGLETLVAGVARGSRLDQRPMPEVAWILVRRSALKNAKDRPALPHFGHNF